MLQLSASALNLLPQRATNQNHEHVRAKHEKQIEEVHDMFLGPFQAQPVAGRCTHLPPQSSIAVCCTDVRCSESVRRRGQGHYGLLSHGCASVGSQSHIFHLLALALEPRRVPMSLLCRNPGSMFKKSCGISKRFACCAEAGRYCGKLRQRNGVH